MPKGKSRGALLCTTALAGTFYAAIAGKPAYAQNDAYAFNLPSESLTSALQDVARISGRQIVFSEKLTAGKVAPPLHGSFTASQALDQLLGGTDLAAEQTAGGGIMVRSKNAEAALNDGAADLGELVVVSSTRIQNAGFEAPTPTTTVSAVDLEQQSKPNVFDAITQLPALQGSTGLGHNTRSTSTGLIGMSSFGLRGLSPLRTLVLLDGQRVVGANYNGVVDVSQMPQMLIQRVDVVTGGASASWGSDAVAGVVNFITDKKFEGFKMNATAGLSTYGDMGNALFQAAAGTSFLGGRAHAEVAGEYSYSDGLLPRLPVAGQHTALPDIDGRHQMRSSGTASYATDASTPAGQPRYVYGALAQNASNAPYGLITSGPKAYTTFGADGIAVPLNLAGNCSVSPTGALQGAIGTTCFGTASDPGDQSTRSFVVGLYDPQTRGTLYGRLSYDLSPSTEIYATVNYGAVRTQNTVGSGTTDKAGMILHCDNAYLPSTNLFGTGLTEDETKAACLKLYPGNNITYASQLANIPVNQQLFVLRTMRRFTAGGDGAFRLFGKDWSWNSYFEHGESDTSIKVHNESLSGSPVNPATGRIDATVSRYNLAQDAVFDANGNIVCRNTVAQLYGCVPFNPFGLGPINQGAQAYFYNQNGPAGTYAGPSAIMTQRQEAFSLSLNGAPFEDWAGPVAIATGYEYREEHYSQRADPYSGGISASTPPTVNEPCTDPFVDCGLTDQGNLGAWNAGNYHNGRGTFHVNEVFLELGIPLLNDSFWGKADLNLAGRHARYSTAGDANTWKVGVTWDTPIPGIRLRALQSRDIRAPNLSELFAPPQGLHGGITNNFTGQTNQDIRRLIEGNVFLKPEKAQTTEIGLVWQPDFLPDFQLSVDYYRIGVKGAISQLSSAQVENLCFLGFEIYCQQDAITTANGVNQSAANPGGPPGPDYVGSVPNQITAVHEKAFNAASLLTDGFDIEASYQFDLERYDVPGTFMLRSLANHVSKFIADTGIPGTQRNVELAGAVGGGISSESYNQAGGEGVTTWKLLETQSYQNDVWGFNLTERWLAGGTSTNKNYIVCTPGTCPKPTVQSPTINYNKVDAMFYLDVGANWNVSDMTQLYVKIDNIANINPPDQGSSTPNNTLYDVIGRMYRIGVRFNN